jgi:uncharacterized membrane protein
MNQPPPTEKQTGKRIVSRGEYVKAQGKIAGLLLVATFVAVLGMNIAAWLAIYFGCPTLDSHGNWVYKSDFDFIIATVCVCVSMVVFGTISRLIYKKVEQATPGVPLTRANTGGLSAPDSLVRASAEPVQEPQAVLLRAGTGMQATPPEQLVRASAGKE